MVQQESIALAHQLIQHRFSLRDIPRCEKNLIPLVAAGKIFELHDQESQNVELNSSRLRVCRDLDRTLYTMDGKAQRKALFRSKLKEATQNREKRIDSPLVRYNEYDQPVCRVCNVTLKSESLWPAHQASRKHHEAIENVRATAAGVTRGSNIDPEPPAELRKPRLSSTLPADFFENQDIKRQKSDIGVGGKVQSVSLPAGSGLADHTHGKKDVSPSVDQSFKVPESVTKTNEEADVYKMKIKERNENKPCTKLLQPSKVVIDADANQLKRALPENFFENKESESQTDSQLSHVSSTDRLEVKQIMRAPPDTFFDRKEVIGNTQSNQFSQPSKSLDGSEAKQVKGALPEGFFDNKDADLRAHGVEPVKVDINDAYKEFEKEIHDNLQEVDNRLEEEEIDGAEIRDEFESIEQKGFREQVELMKAKLMEVKAARLARGRETPAFRGKESSDQSSSGDDDDDDDDFAVDWRAQHL